ISLNMMSLGGLALGIGMLVDNAIVVLENITRHRSFGKDPYQASLDGAAEVSNAIFASTLTTIAVFFPMVFVVGIAGQLFKQLSFTVIFSLVASLFVALSLIPLLASKVKEMKDQNREEDFQNSPYIKKFEDFLRASLARPFFMTFSIMALFAICVMCFGTLDKELMPKMDQGQFMLKVNLPAGTHLEITNGKVEKIEDYILTLPDVEDVSVIIGSTIGKGAEDVLQRLESHQAEISVRLKNDRKMSTKDTVQKVKNAITKMDLKRVQVEYILSESVFSGAVETSSPIVIEVKGKKIPVMMEIIEEVTKMLKKIKGVYGVKTDMPERSPETKITVDKDKAALYQMSVVDIAQVSQVALKGYIASAFKDQGEEVDIRVRLRETDRNEFSKIGRITLSSPMGTKVPLSSFVKFEIGKGPSEIKRNDQERTTLISANIFKRQLKSVFEEIETELGKIDIPDDYTVKLSGESEEMKASFSSLLGALLLSIILVYMIMAAQFESLWQPLIIMFTFPLSLIGVVFALFFTGTSINVIVFLGIIMLGGIVVNNGIVLIDYINVLRAKGMEVFDSVIEASKARLRPILMTAMTTVLGLLPMAMASGEGAEFRAPLAVSVMGGLFVTTFLSLLVIPAIYVFTHNLRVKVFKR
ncbi:MAG: efflux RND transporter permease subunit, partial [Candidatus Omnitrophica bacterium]|nr:efflux RND transporter permease subunit [Candidatus Omnitrophota bacterium]